MITESAPKTEERASELRPPVSWPRNLSANSTEPTLLGQARVDVFDLLWAEDRPLTRSEIERRTKMPRAELCAVIDALCEIRLVRRLNTIIESYTALPVPSR